EKRVFVYQFIPLSAPSALLSLFVDSQRELLEKDYICVKLDARYSNGEAAIRRAGSEASGQPGITILDETGKLLTVGPAGDGGATSILPSHMQVKSHLK